MPARLEVPRRLEAIRALNRNQITESIHLDYKASAAHFGKSREISKDVSATANSDGGMLIYGVAVEKLLPKEIDEGVVTTY